MTANTSPIGLPYPEVEERVADGWDAIRDLAEAVDDEIVADRAALALKASLSELNDEAISRAAADGALDARLDALEADTGWIAATLATGWTAYGGGFATPAYRKVRGLIHLRGMVKATGTPEHTLHIFTLPAGYRPGALEIFAGVGQLTDPSPSLTDVGIRIEISSGGAVTPTVQATTSGGAVAWISLSGITFPADA